MPTRQSIVGGGAFRVKTRSRTEPATVENAKPPPIIGRRTIRESVLVAAANCPRGFSSGRNPFELKNRYNDVQFFLVAPHLRDVCNVIGGNTCASHRSTSRHAPAPALFGWRRPRHDRTRPRHTGSLTV